MERMAKLKHNIICFGSLFFRLLGLLNMEFAWTGCVLPEPTGLQSELELEPELVNMGLASYSNFFYSWGISHGSIEQTAYEPIAQCQTFNLQYQSW